MKKIFIAFGVVFGLVITAILVIPFVIDVDKYRPQILAAVNEKLNGKLELGHLQLSLWGRIGVAVDGLKLKDSVGRSVVEVKDAAFNLPYTSVLSGHPELRVQLNNPAIQVVKNHDGKLNVMNLMKPTSSPSSSSGGTSGATSPSASAGVAQAATVPAIVMNARLTFLLEHARVHYKDEQTGDVYNINDLDLRLKDVSPSSNMPFEILADLDLTAQKKIKVAGKLKVSGNILGHSANGVFDSADAKVDINGDELSIQYPDVFMKDQGVRMGAALEASVGKDKFNVSTLKLALADIELDGSGVGQQQGAATVVDFKAHSNKISLAKLGSLFPAANGASLNGTAQVGVNFKGPLDRLDYGADLRFNKINLTHESLSQPVEVNGSIAVATDQIREMVVRLNAKNFDLTINGALRSFSAPQFKFSVQSNLMDVDGLVKASKKAAEVRKERAETVSNAPTGAGGGTSASPPVVDYNAMLKPLRENPIAAATGTVDFHLKKIKATGVHIEGVQGQLALKALEMSLNNLSMKIFDGTISGNMSINARSAKPAVSTKIVVSGLQTTKMMESQMPFARNTVKGEIGADLNLGGAGLNTTDVFSNWKGSGNLRIKNAVFSTLDIGRQIREGVIERLPPFAKGKVKVPDSLIDRHGEYEIVSTKINMANGTVNISDINGKAYPGKGLDIKGGGVVKFPAYLMDMNLDIIDTYNLLHGDEVARDPRYNHFALSPHVDGTLFSPHFDWGSTLGKLAQNAAKTSGKQALQKAVGGLLGGGDKGNTAGAALGKLLGGGGDSKPAAAPKAEDVKNALKGLFGH